MTTPPGGARWLTEGDVAALVDLDEAIAAVEAALVAQSEGRARNLDKAHTSWSGRGLHAVGAVLDDLVGTKSWVHTPSGATPMLLLWSAERGELVAVIEAFGLGQLRTGAISGVATDWLSSADAAVFAIVGAGPQAAPQVAAVARVRRLTEIRVASRTAERAASFAAELAGHLHCKIIACATIADAVDGADIITTVTRATEPIVTSAMLSSGAHINAVGAITPERREIAADVLPRCDLVAADSVPAATRLAGDLYGARTVALADVVAYGERRPPDSDLTLFKAMGMGISDLAVAALVVDRARAAGLGRPIDAPHRTELRLFAGRNR